MVWGGIIQRLSPTNEHPLHASNGQHGHHLVWWLYQCARTIQPLHYLHLVLTHNIPNIVQNCSSINNNEDIPQSKSNQVTLHIPCNRHHNHTIPTHKRICASNYLHLHNSMVKIQTSTTKTLPPNKQKTTATPSSGSHIHHHGDIVNCNNYFKSLDNKSSLHCRSTSGECPTPGLVYTPLCQTNHPPNDNPRTIVQLP